MCVFVFDKNVQLFHMQFCLSLVMLICVATNLKQCVLCVASFGAAHFLLREKQRKEGFLWITNRHISSFRESLRI